VPTSVHVRWGNPVLTGPRNENPTLEQVEAVFEAYLAELRRVFDAHKDARPRQHALDSHTQGRPL